MNALTPQQLYVADISDQHRGHDGYHEGGQSHFRVEIVSEQFRGQSRIGQQRLVYRALDDLMQTQIHALILITRPPDKPQE
ncbi:MAG: BolA family protein [Pseudomonadota bacterium]